MSLGKVNVGSMTMGQDGQQLVSNLPVPSGGLRMSESGNKQQDCQQKNDMPSRSLGMRFLKGLGKT